VAGSCANELRIPTGRRHFRLERKHIHSTGELKLAMKLLLGQRADADQVRRSFFCAGDKEPSDKFVPVNEETIDWAYHLFDRMVIQPSWHIHFR